MKPIRIVHVLKDPYDIYIGRANRRYRLSQSKWANPFKRKNALEKYERWIKTRPELLGALSELEGKRLGCWCAPKGGITIEDKVICHGQILARLAGGEREGTANGNETNK